MGYDDMRQANHKVDIWVPGAGDDVLVPGSFVLPDATRIGLILNRPEKRLYFYPSKPGRCRPSPSASAARAQYAAGHLQGHLQGEGPDLDATGLDPRRAAAEGDILPAVVPAGPDNPLGQFALRTSAPDYLIHGTNKPWGLGMEVSRGCIRMYPEGVEQLFPM